MFFLIWRSPIVSTMSDEAGDAQKHSDNGKDGASYLNKCDTSRDDTLNDSGMFFSPQPLPSRLVRCASTPISDKALQSLLTLNFEGIGNWSLSSSNHKSKSSSDLSTTEEFFDVAYIELVKTRSEPLITHMCLDGHQELFLSFKCPVSTNLQNSEQKKDIKVSDKAWPQILIKDDSCLHTSDSGIGSDVSVSGSETSHPMTPGPSPALTSKDRDIFDSRKQKQAAAIRPLQRVVRFAHIPGSFKIDSSHGTLNV